MTEKSAASARKDRKRAEIVAIAQDLFFTQGYAGTSMSQVAAALGGSKTTLYSYFQSKEELLLAVVQEVAIPQPDDYDLRTMPTEFRPWLVWFGVSTVRKITSYSYVSLQRLAAAEALRFPEIGRILYEVGVAPSLQTGAERFREAMDKGLLRRADARVALEQFVEMCFGWMLRRLIWNIPPAPTPEEIEQSVHSAVSAFMDGYAPAASKASVISRKRSRR